jgi:hypothetical protein
MYTRLKRAFFAIPVAFFMLVTQMTESAGPQSGETPGNSNPESKNAGPQIEVDWQKLHKLFNDMGETDNHSSSSTKVIRTPFGDVFRTDDGNALAAPNPDLLKPDIQALAIDPSTSQIIYAGTPKGIFKSINGGDIWAPTGAGLANTDIRSLAIDPSAPHTIYAGMKGGGMLKSTDGGSTWVKMPTSPGIQLTGMDKPSRAINPSTPQTMKAGAVGGVVNSDSDIGNTNRSESDVQINEERIDQIRKQLAQDTEPLLAGNTPEESGAEMSNILSYYAEH